MNEKLLALKSEMRSLVVSVPTTMDVRRLQSDYRNTIGRPLPIAEFGYTDPVKFLRELCADSFVLQGPPTNPILTLIVPKSLKHIDAHVQKQKVPSSIKHHGRRRSVQARPSYKPQPSSTLIRYIGPNLETNLIKATFDTIRKQAVADFNDRATESTSYNLSTSTPDAPVKESTSRDIGTPGGSIEDLSSRNVTPPVPVLSQSLEDFTEVLEEDEDKTSPEQRDSGHYSRTNLQNFRKRTPVYSSSQCLDSESGYKDEDSKMASDSGRHTASSDSSARRMQLDALKTEVKQLIVASPEGVWCTALLRLYRERYGRELNFSKFGLTSIVGFLSLLEADIEQTAVPDRGDWLLRDRRAPPSPATAARPVLRVPRVPRREPVDPEDALPFIKFDPDVFPDDCMHYADSIPPLPLHALQPSAMLGVQVGEVYSPAHLWLILLGAEHNLAMEAVMDDMNEYYKKGEGATRVLAAGARVVGQYCAAMFEGDWHRAVIVRVVDSDHVKVRHVDYGTVDRVAAAELRPLLSRWGALPAQALRARLGGVRPCASGRRWPHAATQRLLQLVSERHLVANVVDVDCDEQVVEVLLIDTTTDQDLIIGDQLVRDGHADPHPDSALFTGATYLFPTFTALENGATPNYAEIYTYLRDGIALERVEAYRRHVPGCLPLAPPTPPAPLDDSTDSSADGPTTPPPVIDHRVPLFSFPREPSPPRELSPPLEPSPPRELIPTREMSPPREPSPPPRTASHEPVPPLRPITKTGQAMPLPTFTNPQPPVRVQWPPYYMPPPPPPPPNPYMQQPHAYPAPVPPGLLPPYHAPPGFFPVYPNMVGPPLHYLPPAPVRPLPSAQSVASLAAPGAMSPPPPYNGETQSKPTSDVTLSVSECEVFRLLSLLDPNAAHWYMVDKIARSAECEPATTAAAPAPRVSTLNPLASEFRHGATAAGAPAAPEGGSISLYTASPTTRRRLLSSLPYMQPPPGFGDSSDSFSN